MELTAEQALQKGIEAHKAGKVQEADRYYTAILKANPKHPDANHNMGVLAVDVGKVEAAFPFFKKALDSNPNIDQFWLSYIDALIKLDRKADARTIFNQAKSKGVKGDGFDQIELQLNTLSVEVKNEIQENIPTTPNILDELKLDKALKFAEKKIKDGLSEEAKKIYQDIKKKFPKNKKALNGIKTLASKTLANPSDMEEPPSDQLKSLVKLYTQRRYQEALNEAKKLLIKFPSTITLYNIIGAANKGLGKPDEAIEAYTKALSIKPDYAEAYNNMGVALKDQGKLDEAIEAYTKAFSIKSDYTDAYYNMGVVLQEQGKLDEAIETYTKALSRKPDYADAYNNMGNALKDQGKLEEAIEAYKKALSIKPDYADAYSNMSFVKLQLDKLPEGIKLREWRFKTKSFQPFVRTFKAPRWDGTSPIQDKTLLVWGEQGPGDIIIWCSCLNYFSSICSNIIVECPLKLIELLTFSFPKITFRSERKNSNYEIEDFDYQVPMETLFGYACLSGTITDDQPSYIIPNQERVNYWINKLRENTQKICVGISWKSPVMTTKRLNNYADLSFWKPLLQNKNYKFFNLQSSDFEDDLQRISRDFDVDVINFDQLDHYNDLAEVAAFCKALDKSISIATAVSTISAAVGTHTVIPTWRQSPWNNVIFNSRGPKIDLYYRNTWETWDNAFNDILESFK